MVLDFLFYETGSIYDASLFTIFHDKLAAIVVNLLLILVHLQVKDNYKEKIVFMPPVTEEKESMVSKVDCTSQSLINKHLTISAT